MLTKTLILAGSLALGVSFGGAVLHQAQHLFQVEDAVVALASPQALSRPDADARLHALQVQAQNIAGVQTQPHTSEFVPVDRWAQQ